MLHGVYMRSKNSILPALVFALGLTTSVAHANAREVLDQLMAQQDESLMASAGYGTVTYHFPEYSAPYATYGCVDDRNFHWGNWNNSSCQRYPLTIDQEPEVSYQWPVAHAVAAAPAASWSWQAVNAVDGYSVSPTGERVHMCLVANAWQECWGWVKISDKEGVSVGPRGEEIHKCLVGSSWVGC